MSDVKEFEGERFELIDSVSSMHCDGCHFFDRKSCKGIPECGNQIFKKLEPGPKPPIKSLDEHEWSGLNITGGSINSDGDIEIECNTSHWLILADEDLRVILNAKGFDMVKRET